MSDPGAMGAHRDPLPAIAFVRTDAERADEALSWARDDQRFFAAGACHILAFRFVERHPGFWPTLIRPRPADLPGNHVYATDGTRAFDFNGWSTAADLVRVNVAACSAQYPGWDHELIGLGGRTLEECCATYHHRRPDQFAHLPWARADAYLDRLA